MKVQPVLKDVRRIYLPAARAALTVVDEVVGEIEGYIALWGTPDNPDWYGTYFDKARPPEMALDFVPFPLMYEHSEDAQIRREIIGKVVEIFFDDLGIRFKGYLDRSLSAFYRFVDELRRRELSTSSGSAPHLVDFDDDGRFAWWILAELTLTKYPAEERMPAVEIVRSTPEGQRQAVGDMDTVISSQRNTSGGTSMKLKKKAATPENIRASLQELLKDDMQDASPEEVLTALVEEYGLEPIQEMVNQMTPPEGEGEDTTESTDEDERSEADEAGEGGEETSGQLTADEVLQAFAALLQGRSEPPAQPKKPKNPKRNNAVPPHFAPPNKPTPPVATRRQPGGTAPSGAARIQVSSKFDGLTAPEMALGYMMLRSLLPKPEQGKTSPVSPEYLTAMSYKTAQLIERNDKSATDLAVVRSFPFTSSREVLQSDVVRANEIMAGASSEGAEWIDELQGTSLWEKVRQENPLYERLLALGMEEKELPQGFASETIPLEGDDPTFYVAAGSTDLDADTGEAKVTYDSSKYGTGEANVTVAKLSMRMTFKQELIEDSIINIVSEAQRKVKMKWNEEIESIIINGDTALGATTNINLIDGTPAAAPARPSYTLLNGLLKLALVTNTANKRDAETTLTEADYLTLLPLLGDEGVLATDLDRIMFIVDNSTYFASLNLATLKTRDTFTNATIEDGVLTRIWGVPVGKSARMKLANADGKRSATPGNNTKGRIALVRPDLWTSRWKRRLQTNVTYWARQDVTEFVAHSRWGIAYRDNEAVAVSYNVDTTIA